MDVTDIIRQRHSVRTYLDKPIEKEKVEELEKVIAECNAKGDLHLQLCPSAGKTFNRLLNRYMGLGSAPSIIACVGHDDDTLSERIGYFGEKVVLKAQEIGLNTCWAGTFNSKNVPAQVGESERLVIVIAIGYGATPGHERKSKSYDQVVPSESEKPAWFKFGVEMALLAPTALNQQKFEIDLSEDGTVSFKNKGGVYSKVDLGIVKRHFDIGAEYAKDNM